MKIMFADDSLGLVETAEAGTTRLPAAVIRVARRKLTVLRAAVDDRSLRNWKSLRHETMAGEHGDRRFVRLTDEYRMVFELNERQEPPTTTIIAIEAFH
jgi:toxin HigB-1